MLEMSSRASLDKALVLLLLPVASAAAGRCWIGPSHGSCAVLDWAAVEGRCVCTGAPLSIPYGLLLLHNL